MRNKQKKNTRLAKHEKVLHKVAQCKHILNGFSDFFYIFNDANC